MRKRILPLISSLIICIAMLCPLYVHATPLDPNAEASLTLHYEKDGNAFPDQQIGIFRVAEAFSDGSFALIEPFASFPVNIHGITKQEQWHTVAQTLSSYIVADHVKPDRETKTDENGTATFSALKTGLYFVRRSEEHTSELQSR